MSSMIVLTGGPGAGKSAVLELVKKNFCDQIVCLPEAASIVFGGGFPRHETLSAKRAAQRAIYHVQREQEALFQAENSALTLLCDRGTLDGLAYWPENESSYWESLATSKEEELARYFAVIHLRVPSLNGGYNHSNPLRTENAKQALEIDAAIERAWDGHPQRYFVENASDFIEKARSAVEILKSLLDECCKAHELLKK